MPGPALGTRDSYRSFGVVVTVAHALQGTHLYKPGFTPNYCGILWDLGTSSADELYYDFSKVLLLP